MANLTAVIVTYNSATVLARLLATISSPDMEIVVVDNGSTDGCQQVANSFANVRVIQRGNIGYGRAANVGFREVRTPYALLLNPDVEMARSEIDKMIACMEANPQIGILGANMTGTRAEGLTEVTWIVGALMMIRMQALANVGMFDENIFLFYEETDLCQRFKQAGWQLAVLQSATAMHEAGTSSPPSLKVLKIKAWHAAWSKAYYYRKHFSYLTYMRKTATKLLYAVCRMIRGIYTFRREQIIKNAYELRGIMAYICGMSAFKNDVGRLT